MNDTYCNNCESNLLLIHQLTSEVSRLSNELQALQEAHGNLSMQHALMEIKELGSYIKENQTLLKQIEHLKRK